MIAWQPITDEQLAAELAGRANGRRDNGQRSGCGGYLVARLPSHHVLVGDSWELWVRGPAGWRISSCLARREWALEEVERREQRAAGGTAA